MAFLRFGGDEAAALAARKRPRYSTASIGVEIISAPPILPPLRTAMFARNCWRRPTATGQTDQPQNAATAALAIADADLRQSALDAVIAGWGQIDPKGLADFAINNLPDGSQKTHALSDALVFLAGDNVVDAANWIKQFNLAPEFDQGEAAIATQQDVMKQPDVAFSGHRSSPTRICAREPSRPSCKRGHSSIRLPRLIICRLPPASGPMTAPISLQT